jgi:hypothetical protein
MGISEQNAATELPLSPAADAQETPPHLLRWRRRTEPLPDGGLSRKRCPPTAPLTR